MLNNEAFDEIQSFHDTTPAAAPTAAKKTARPKNEIEAITICDKALTGMPWGQKQLVLDFLYGKHVSPPQPLIAQDLDNDRRPG